MGAGCFGRQALRPSGADGQGVAARVLNPNHIFNSMTQNPQAGALSAPLGRVSSADCSHLDFLRGRSSEVQQHVLQEDTTITESGRKRVVLVAGINIS
eukprot:SAG31_NODE_2510_length_5586_cov_2.799344_2_plen_98_part_00